MMGKYVPSHIQSVVVMDHGDGFWANNVQELICSHLRSLEYRAGCAQWVLGR